MRPAIRRTLFPLRLALAFALCAPASAAARASGSQDAATPATVRTQAGKRAGEFRTFGGTVGKYKVQMRLRRDGAKLAGAYFYEHVKSDLRLEGAIDEKGNFTLREFDPSGAQTGLFEGAWSDGTEDEPGASLSGQWSRPDGTRKAEFSLSEMAVNFRGGARILTREMKDADKRKRFEVSVEYPQIEGMPPARAAGFNEAARALAAKVAADFRKSMIGYDAGSLPPEMVNSYLDMGYYINYADDELVSIGFAEESFYAGAAHPNHATVVLNYDLKTGRVLRLADLFQPGAPYLKVISDYCIAKLEGDGDSGGDDDWIKQGASAKAENYRSWLVKKDGLEITFDQYQVAPYAAGPQYVTVPFDALKKIVRPGGPLARFVK
jgi:hypothetical protein